MAQSAWAGLVEFKLTTTSIYGKSVITSSTSRWETVTQTLAWAVTVLTMLMASSQKASTFEDIVWFGQSDMLPKFANKVSKSIIVAPFKITRGLVASHVSRDKVLVVRGATGFRGELFTAAFWTRERLNLSTNQCSHLSHETGCGPSGRYCYLISMTIFIWPLFIWSIHLAMVHLDCGP